MSDKPPQEKRETYLQPTPGCGCSVCRRARECQEKGAPDGREQAGRMQKDADILGWKDHGSEHPKTGKRFGYLSPAEAADRREREEKGLKELPAAYRPLLGPAPQVKFGDRIAALTFLRKVEAAIEQGGWTRSEWRRLHAIKEKWKARAEGNDPRYEEVGNNPRARVTPDIQARIRMKRLLVEMKEILGRSSRGD